MFSRKKSSSTPLGSTPAMRGRDGNKQAGTAPNPLARRFQADSEPDTIDLTDPGRFHSPADDAEPETATSLEKAVPNPDTTPVVSPLREILSVDPDTGKFYVHPAGGDVPVLLGDQVVNAPTELRHGDRIRVGAAEFEFLPG